MYSKILITGSSGFIGNEVCNFFFKKNYKVYALDKNLPKFSDKILFFRCDIMNKKRLFKILKNIKPEIIIHLAAKTDLDGKNINYYKENFIGTKNIIEVANSVSSIKRVIFASSLLVNKIGTNSSDYLFYNPDTTYGQSKVLMEQIIRFSKCNFKWCIVRPTTIWGDNIQNHFKTLLRLIEKRLYFNFGFKKISKSYGYVKNSAYQIYKLTTTNDNLFNQKVYYIADYEPLDLREWINRLSKKLIGKKAINLPLFVAQLLSKIGDILLICGYKKFPIQSFRLNNILTSFKVDTRNLKKICGKLPYNLDSATLNFINSYKAEK
jgi:nucleoside-diphosphate-sugar epimerase